jgi:hypothetical protein
MPTPTYTPLATVTLGASASSVTFSSIPATYRDLIVVLNGGVSAANSDLVRIRLNGDSGSNYSDVYMSGSSGGANSSTGSGTSHITGRIFTGSNLGIFQVMDYSATDKHKTGLTRCDSLSNDSTQTNAFRYASTSAITSFQVFFATYLFATGTTVSLYGIAA